MSALEPLVPPHRLRWYPAGEHCLDPAPASLLLVDHGGLPSTLIRFGERLMAAHDPELRGFTWNDHAAIIRAGGVVSEMGFKGHELRPLASYAARLYCLVEWTEADLMAVRAALAVDRQFDGVGYGWASYLPLVLDAVTGARFAGSWGSTMICSTHAALVCASVGLLCDRQPGGVTPAHLSRYVGASPPF